MDMIDQLTALHQKCKELLIKQDFLAVRDIMAKYNNDKSDPNEIKILLVITKSFKNEITLREIRSQMVDRLNKMIEKLSKHETTPIHSNTSAI